MKSAGLSEDFALHVGHLIHSIRLEDLRRFEPDASEENGIPNVNMDLDSEDILLHDAPSRPYTKPGRYLDKGQMVTQWG